MKTNRRRTRHLVCPECGEAARRYPPRRWVATTGPRPRWSHPDGEPLCPVPGATGSRPADSHPAPPARRVRRRVPPAGAPTAPVTGTADPGPVYMAAGGDMVAVAANPASATHQRAPLTAASDRQTEALRELADPIAVGGDSDWDVAVYVYALHTPLTCPGCTVPAGVYVRTVRGKSEAAYPVTDITAAIGYADETERRYIVWAEATE